MSHNDSIKKLKDDHSKVLQEKTKTSEESVKQKSLA
tara:strand:- start:209 stop:316 length:108 start_codon:yes stop_codon:yes gene_type:complete